MANPLQAGSYTITSILQWNVALGVETTNSASQPIISEAPESKFTITPGGDGTYRIAIGRYPSVAAISRGFMENAVSASVDPSNSTSWKIEYHGSVNAYTISAQDPLGLGALAWTIGTDMVAREPIQLRPFRQGAQPLKSQTFGITPV